jgi:hypothetical protein
MDETRVGRVKRTLTFLSKRTDTEREPYTAIVDEACAVRGDLERAAAFVETVGIDRLEAAIEAAETDGALETAERGRRAARAFRSYRRAASDGAGKREPQNEEDEPRENEREPRDGTDHLHSGGGTAKRRTGQPSS